VGAEVVKKHTAAVPRADCRQVSKAPPRRGETRLPLPLFSWDNRGPCLEVDEATLDVSDLTFGFLAVSATQDLQIALSWKKPRREASSVVASNRLSLPQLHLIPI
jgi:hypothetical protein